MSDNKKYLFKRETLIRNLKKLVKRVPKLDLPVTIVAIYAFGGILREKEHLHDLDLLILYKMTRKQKLIWEKFRSSFQPQELRPHFDIYMKRGIPLRQAVKDKSLANVLRRKGINPKWAGCFSWTEIYRPSTGIFIPSPEIVARRMLLKGIKGLQVLLFRYEDFIKNKLPITAKNYVLAWDPEKPDIEKNLFNRTLQEKIELIGSELDHFLNEELPKYKKEYEEAKERVIHENSKIRMKINLKSLDEQHIDIKRTGDESFEELCDKCEQARIEMRKYREETIVLKQLAQSISFWNKVKNEQYYREHSPEEYVTLWVIQGIKKVDLKEKRVREILKILQLPESHVVAIKRYGTRTEYEILPKRKEERDTLLKQIELEELRSKYLKEVMRVIKSIDRDAHAILNLTDEGKPIQLTIRIRKLINEYNESERAALINNLKTRGFKVKVMTRYLCGEKRINLYGVETPEDLEKL